MVGVVRDASSGDLVTIVEENLRAWLPLFELLEGARFEEKDGYVRWTSATRLPLFNGVMGAPAAADLGPATDDALAPFDEGDIPLVWVVPPTADLTAHLEARGFEIERLPGMTTDLSTLPQAVAPPGTSVHEVDDVPSELETATTIALTTNGFPAEATPPFLHVLARMPRRRRIRTFLARVDGVPAAASTVFTAAGVAGLYNVGTLPGFRGRGLGRLVSVAALEAGRAEGYRLGVLEATELGEPVYRAIGFEECCRFTFATRGSRS